MYCCFDTFFIYEVIILAELSEEEQALLIKRENDLEHYWYHVEQIVSTSQDGSAIRNMATIEYQCPPPLTTIDEDTNEDEKKVSNRLNSIISFLPSLILYFYHHNITRSSINPSLHHWLSYCTTSSSVSTSIKII